MAPNWLPPVIAILATGRLAYWARKPEKFGTDASEKLVPTSAISSLAAPPSSPPLSPKMSRLASALATSTVSYEVLITGGRLSTQ